MPFPATHPALERTLAARGYADPTPVQEAVLQPDATGRDLLVSAQTGSGKTVAFGLAFAADLLGEAPRFERPTTPLALIVAPTRELAMQVERELAWLYADTGARIITCIGGMDPRAEARALGDGCHIVVGTPGRLVDHLQRGRLNFEALKVVVLDEADQMLDLGFKDELEELLKAMPESRRTLLFSATIARQIAGLAKQYQRDALRIDTVNRNEQHADIEYRAVRVMPHEVEHAVVNVLRYFEAPVALVFCAMREQVHHLQSNLIERGFTSVALSGDLTQNERSRAVQMMREGQARVCVATDVAARGLDLPDLSLVIHASLPNSAPALLHRSGRTGRAGRKGTSVLIVPYDKERKAGQVLFNAGVRADWSGPPQPENINEKDKQRLLQEPFLTAPTAPDDQALAASLLEGRSAEDLAAALIRLYRARLPAAEEVTEPRGSMPAAKTPPPRYARDERPASRPDKPSFRKEGFRTDKTEKSGYPKKKHPPKDNAAPQGFAKPGKFKKKKGK
jgi:ATP-dependent RNA helicase DeaD